MKNLKLLFTLLAVSTVAMASDVVTPVAPEVVAPEVVAPEVVAPEVVAPEVVAPEVVAPEVVAPEVVAPEVVVSWSDTLQAPFVWINEKLQSADNSFNGLLVASDAKNDKGELTYAAQAQNALVTVVQFPFARPVTTTVAALTVYVGYMAFNELNDTKKTNSKN